MALLTLGLPFSSMPHPTGSLAFTTPDCGLASCQHRLLTNSMVQYARDGSIMFVHANMPPKWFLGVQTDWDESLRRWTVISPGLNITEEPFPALSLRLWGCGPSPAAGVCVRPMRAAHACGPGCWMCMARTGTTWMDTGGSSVGHVTEKKPPPVGADIGRNAAARAAVHMERWGVGAWECALPVLTAVAHAGSTWSGGCTRSCSSCAATWTCGRRHLTTRPACRHSCAARRRSPAGVCSTSPWALTSSPCMSADCPPVKCANVRSLAVAPLGACPGLGDAWPGHTRLVRDSQIDPGV